MLKQKPKTFAVSSVFSVFLFTATNAFSTPNIEGEWLNRSKDFSLVVWIMGPVVCGYLSETGGARWPRKQFVLCWPSGQAFD